MLGSIELPDCVYSKEPIFITPISPTPNHSLYLSNLDDQKFLRFSIKYLYLYTKSINLVRLKSSLSRVLVDYYPLAGRVRTCPDHKLQVDCNGEGAIFAEAFLDLTADELLVVSNKPDKSWRKLLYKVEATNFLDIPPLVVQVTNLRCGGMILCTAINHCLCDGIGTAQFLHAWAHFTKDPTGILPITPFHSRHVLKPRDPPQITSIHPTFTKIPLDSQKSQFSLNLFQYLQSQPITPASITFSQSQILHLKRQCSPSVKSTSFEVLASHTWRCWVKSLDLPSSINVKLLFSVNIRKAVKPELPEGYYGNGFVLGCAEAPVKHVVNGNFQDTVKLVQNAKSELTSGSIKSVVDLLEDKTVKTDLSASLVISQWSRLSLEEVDFGEGKPIQMGPLTSDIYCLFLPSVGEFDAVRVLVSLPEGVVKKFEYYMTELWDVKDVNGDIIKGHLQFENPKMISA
ncbi:PREDICTED: omega-hydroxypalmitate O-feruloyl transferase [Nicotiana attenuata]|uniref:Omega-hydroxypalmitate o-feruloyl transferase n=1 Tax=Nicotiana attenuata TaxID=49451 RepID=A0A1J6IGZ3_NICAT|nr:PREDICTED: omega-hydroxypalmitate O-feruloyl transferase [Nicotiana attenuata]OIT04150.1 omega-hydroxypalmitate o-feruloyl transferase [Nicotiana attenuata]